MEEPARGEDVVEDVLIVRGRVGVETAGSEGALFVELARAASSPVNDIICLASAGRFTFGSELGFCPGKPELLDTGVPDGDATLADAPPEEGAAAAARARMFDPGATIKSTTKQARRTAKPRGPR